MFRKEYSDAIIEDNEHYYGLAKEKSLTSARDYIEFCKKHNLDYTPVKLDLLNMDKLELCVKVKESLIDPIKLKEICWNKLKESNVNVVLRHEATEEELENHDLVINCTYAALNSLLKKYPGLQKDYQYELCEKIVVKLPKEFHKKSIVIMDGPFMCIDHYGKTGMFVVGNVVHAIHQSNIGKHPLIDEKFKSYLNNGIIKNPPITNFNKFVESTSEYIPLFREAEHVGSMYTIRTVLPYVDNTDTRPTIVEKIDDRLIMIFSGKIANCVQASEEVARVINKNHS